MSVDASNQNYVNQVMAEVHKAMDMAIQTVVEETLNWVVTGTVQDSGNAAFFWTVNLNGTSLPAANLKGQGPVGLRDEKRQPASSVDPQAGLAGLASEATIVYDAVLRRYTEGVKKQIVFDGTKYPTIKISNTIDELQGESGEYDFYVKNAFLFVALAEGEAFGAARGYEKAANKSSILRTGG